MKRSDLVVGESYYYAVGTGWLDRSGYGNWGRAVVVSTEPHTKPDWLGWGDRTPRKVDRGNGVLVDLYVWEWAGPSATREGRAKRTVVQLGQLRGLWLTLKAEVDAAEVARRASDNARLDAEEEDQRIRQLVVARAIGLGLTGVRLAAEITISTADLAVLLDTYEQSGT